MNQNIHLVCVNSSWNYSSNGMIPNFIWYTINNLHYLGNLQFLSNHTITKNIMSDQITCSKITTAKSTVSAPSSYNLKEYKTNNTNMNDNEMSSSNKNTSSSSNKHQKTDKKNIQKSPLNSNSPASTSTKK